MNFRKQEIHETKTDYIDYLMEEIKKEHPYQGTNDVDLYKYEREIYNLAVVEYERFVNLEKEDNIEEIDSLEEVSVESEVPDLKQEDSEEFISAFGIKLDVKPIAFKTLLQKICFVGSKKELESEVDALLNDDVFETVEEKDLALEIDADSEENIDLGSETSIDLDPEMDVDLKENIVSEEFPDLETDADIVIEESVDLEAEAEVYQECIELEPKTSMEEEESLDETDLTLTDEQIQEELLSLETFFDTIQIVPGVLESIEAYQGQFGELEENVEGETVLEKLIRLKNYIQTIYQIPGVSEAIDKYNEFHKRSESTTGDWLNNDDIIKKL